ncbi:MAG: (2Fe-2S)-binding protein [Eubacteriales bacterium]|nr:(2Fe-2S)-binding protein [Eubacteriales bacterium]
MLNIINFTLNGENVEVAIDEKETLLDVLRNKCNMTSVKKGCEVGECGACTVLINGRAVDTCLYLAMWAKDKSILTVEGLMNKKTGELSKIQQAFITETAVQCGFCIPGIIMTAVEVLEYGRPFTRDELRKLISGHLCRCTGYENILNAIEKVMIEKYGLKK